MRDDCTERLMLCLAQSSCTQRRLHLEIQVIHATARIHIKLTREPISVITTVAGDNLILASALQAFRQDIHGHVM